MNLQVWVQLLTFLLLTLVSAVHVLELFPYSEFGDTGQNPQIAQNTKIGQNRRRPSLPAVSQPGLDLAVLPNWPNPPVNFGQVSAVSIDKNGNIVVFHRCKRIWNGETFNVHDQYQKENEGPIRENPVVVLDSSTGQIIQEWGSGQFFLPHGLTVDAEDNLWLTDVAMHQVFKYPPLSHMRENATKTPRPILALGERFQPGKDTAHFCKPSAVAVMKNGDFFVSDGYCNSRIMKFNKDGQLVLVWGRSVFRGAHPMSPYPLPYQFLVPHALTLAEDRNVLCVADRENGRVQCFDASNGTYVYQLISEQFGSRVFSVAYTSANGGVFYVVNGPEQLRSHSVRLFEVDAETLQVRGDVGLTNDADLSNPHDVAVTPDGSAVYVAELSPYRVWKFVHKGTWAEADRLLAASPTADPTAAPLVSTKATDRASDSPKASQGPAGSAAPNSEQDQINSGEPRAVGPLLAVNGSYLVTGAGIAVLGLSICASTIAIALCLKARRRDSSSASRSRPWMNPKSGRPRTNSHSGAMIRDFGSSSADSFKLGQLLDSRSRRGFEQVSTEESDEDRGEQRA